MAGGPRVPQRQAGDAVGVDVLGSALEFGERRQRGPRLVGELVVGLQQHRLVGLHDERTVGHAIHYSVVGRHHRVMRWMAKSRSRPDAESKATSCAPRRLTGDTTRWVATPAASR